MRASSALPAFQRTSMRSVCPSIQPRSPSPFTNADKYDCGTASVAAAFISTPIRRTLAACCASAASGHAAAVLIALAGWQAGGGLVFALGLLAFAAHLVWQIARLDIDDPENCLAVFKSNRDAGLILFAGLVVDAMLRAAMWAVE